MPEHQTEVRQEAEPSDREEAVAGFFSAHAVGWRSRYGAKDFDSHEYQTRARIAVEWLGELAPPSGGRLLEVGCGAGVQSHAAAQLGWQVTGVDLAKGMLREAAARGGTPRWLAGGVDALPFRRHQFKAVLMNGVIGYVPDPPGALRAVRDQLLPGGHFIVSWASHPPLFFDRISKVLSVVPNFIYLRLKQLLTRGDNRVAAADSHFYDRYLRRWGPKEFENLMTEAGFELVRIRSQNFGQFRFMGKAIWPERFDMLLSGALAWCADQPFLRGLRRGARTHIALATLPAPRHP